MLVTLPLVQWSAFPACRVALLVLYVCGLRFCFGYVVLSPVLFMVTNAPSSASLCLPPSRLCHSFCAWVGFLYSPADRRRRLSLSVFLAVDLLSPEFFVYLPSVPRVLLTPFFLISSLPPPALFLCLCALLVDAAMVSFPML